MSSIVTSGACPIDARFAHRRRCRAQSMQVGDPRDRLEALRGDRPAAAPARAVRARVQALERLLDLAELGALAVAQGEVALLLEDLARRGGLRAVGHLARALDRLAELDAQARRLRLEGGADGGEVAVGHDGDRTRRRPARRRTARRAPDQRAQRAGALRAREPLRDR